MAPTAIDHRSSIGFESTLSGAPPPCYSSQMGSASATPTLDGDCFNGDNADDEQPSISRLQTEFYQLPSPYSAEELVSMPQTYRNSCSHGYTHTHSLCTSSSPTVYNPSLNPHVIDMNICSQALPSVVTPPRARTLRYSSLPSPDENHNSPARSSSYHPAASYSAHGHLTYLSHDTHDLNCEPQDHVVKGPYPETHLHGGSTATISFPQPANIPTQPVSARTTKSKSNLPESPVPSKAHASNFVALSRSSTRQKRGFFYKLTSMSITGSFTIDPQLNIPSGLTTTLPGAQSPRARRSLALDGGPRENLRLEVENGGIDVDIHLVGYTSKTVTLTNTPTRIKLALKTGSDPKAKTTTFPLVARIHAPKPRPPFLLRASTIPFALPPPSLRLTPSKLLQADIGNEMLNAETGSTRLTQTNNSSKRPTRPVPQPINTNSKSPLTLHLPRTFRGPLTIHVAAGDIDAHVFLSKELQDAVVVLSETALERGYFVGGLVTQDEEEEEGEGEAVTNCQRCGKNQKTPKRNHITRGSSSGSSSNSKGRDKCDDHERYRCFSCGCQCVCGMAECESDAGKEAGEGDGHEDGEGRVEDEEWSGDRVEVMVGRGNVYLQFMGEKDPHRREGWFWGW